MEELPINIQPFRKRYQEIESQLAEPDVFKDAMRASSLNREHTRIRKILEIFDEANECYDEILSTSELLNDPELGLAAQEEVTLLERRGKICIVHYYWPCYLRKLILGKILLLKYVQGRGGDEASLFAADLFRMYCRYGENKSWGFECLSQSSSETGGFKEVVFVFKGDDAWTKMRFESGVHRVQRIPVTEAGGRIHTSTATVAVLPEAQDVEVSIDPQDLEVSVCRASGPGVKESIPQILPCKFYINQWNLSILCR